MEDITCFKVNRWLLLIRRVAYCSLKLPDAEKISASLWCFSASGASWVESETGPSTWRAGREGRKAWPLHVASHRFNKQGATLQGLSWAPQNGKIAAHQPHLRVYREASPGSGTHMVLRSQPHLFCRGASLKGLPWWARWSGGRGQADIPRTEGW